MKDIKIYSESPCVEGDPGYCLSTSDSAERDAKGRDIIYPQKNELFIDIDDAESLRAYNRGFDHLSNFIQLKEIRKTKSAHKLNGWHIVVQVAGELSDLDRVALQACLGSDRIRELNGILRTWINDPNPTLFFEPKSPVLKRNLNR